MGGCFATGSVAASVATVLRMLFEVCDLRERVRRQNGSRWRHRLLALNRLYALQLDDLARADVAHVRAQPAGECDLELESPAQDASAARRMDRDRRMAGRPPPEG